MQKITASIVLYHNNNSQLVKAISSFLDITLKVKLYLIDNSANDSLKVLSQLNDKIEYIYNDANLGYGTAHNIAISKSIHEGSKYHVVLNPDLYFDNDVIETLFEYMENNSDVGNVMPKVLYPNGDFQYLCKLLPTPVDWFGRFISNYIPLQYFKQKNEKFEMRFADFETILEVPYLSGAFMFLRTSTLKKSGLFDESIFLHTEDTDLSRRIFEHSKNIYYPYVYIYHEHNREAYRSKKVMLMQVKSMIYYFNKWGWFFDKKRTLINEKTILKYKKR